MISWFQAVVLGLVQGLTEFLPISSSAHLRVVSAFAGWHDPGAAFTAVTQIGTETAVIIYFRQKIWRVISHWVASLHKKEMRADPDARMGWMIIVGSVPIGVLGLAFQDQIEGPFRDLRLIATTLIVFGLILYAADWFAGHGDENSGGRHRAGGSRKELDDLTVKDGLLYGFAQALALIPGVSRSGATVSGGLFLGYSRKAAAEYSFLLAVPAVVASGGLELTKIGEEGHVSWGPTILATVIAFGVGYAVIAWFMNYIKTRSFAPFVYYRIALGILLFALIGFGVLDPKAASDV